MRKESDISNIEIVEDDDVVKGVLPSNDEIIEFFNENDQERMAVVYQKVLEVCNALGEEGGLGLIVGGAIRDIYLGKIPKDIDVEVYGVEWERLIEIADEIGNVKEVGKAFGILKLTFGEGIDVDLSMPRRDSKVGEGHKGIKVEMDKDMGVKDAALRRDFTINAMAYDPLTGELYDHYGGRKDLDDRILRVTDPELFKDDPLRVMRGMQFVGRYELTVEPRSEEIMREMVPSLKELPGERIFDEWEKLLTKSKRPSNGLKLGLKLGLFGEIHPELEILNQTDQEPDWHPEGNVWEHTLLSVDEAIRVARMEGYDDHKTMMVMLSVLCHDLGKPETTEIMDGRIKSHGHEEAGGEPTKAFLRSLRADNLTVSKVVKLVTSHMVPSMLYRSELDRQIKVSDGAIRRLASRISPATIEELVVVAEADHLGRGPFRDSENSEQFILSDGFPAGVWLMEKAKRINVYEKKAPNIIMGRDLLEYGFEPGKNFSILIKLADNLRDDLGYDRERILNLIDKESIEKTIESFGRELEGLE